MKWTLRTKALRRWRKEQIAIVGKSRYHRSLSPGFVVAQTELGMPLLGCVILSNLNNLSKVYFPLIE